MSRLLSNINFHKLAISCLILGSTSLWCGCDDFFQPDNNSILYGEEYIGEGSEIYSGYLGIITCLQKVGDKAIYLTDTRAELLEPTGNNDDLYALYSYDTDLGNNTYANPAEYYDLIIACNDFLHKASTFHHHFPTAIPEEHYSGLISGVVRLKTWTYFTMARIYGEVVWFDEPLKTMSDYKDSTRFERLNLDQTIRRCVDYMNRGFEGIDGTSTMSWVEWINSAGISDENADNYYYWDYMVPEHFMLSAELALWQQRWQDVVDILLPRINRVFEGVSLSSSEGMWMMNAGYKNAYHKMWDNTAPRSTATISVILYDYAHNQTNELLRHFNSEYMLRPSLGGIANFTASDFNPTLEGTTSNFRLSNTIYTHSSGNNYLQKYRRYSGSDARPNTLQDDVHIYLYRSAELYFMLLSAFNHISGKQYELETLMNSSIDTEWANCDKYVYPTIEDLFPGFSPDWTRNSIRGTRSYPTLGIRTVYAESLPRSFKSVETIAGRKHNDVQILQEYCLEFAGEGKTMMEMIRVARIYNDPSIIADIVCRKYPEEMKEDIRNKIMSGGYFVSWDIDSPSTSF